MRPALHLSNKVPLQLRKELLWARLKRHHAPPPLPPPPTPFFVKFIWWHRKERTPPPTQTLVKRRKERRADTWWIRSWLICCSLPPSSDRGSKTTSDCRQRIQMTAWDSLLPEAQRKGGWTCGRMQILYLKQEKRGKRIFPLCSRINFWFAQMLHHTVQKTIEGALRWKYFSSFLILG